MSEVQTQHQIMYGQLCVPAVPDPELTHRYLSVTPIILPRIVLEGTTRAEWEREEKAISMTAGLWLRPLHMRDESTNQAQPRNKQPPVERKA